MKKALPLANENLQQTVHDEFDLRITGLEFIPIGESSWLYKATRADGEPLAIKVQLESNPAVDEVRRYLAESSYPNVPEVYLTKAGNVQATMGDLHVSVEDYIDHASIKTHDATPTDQYLFTLGKALYDLHCIKKPHGRGVIPQETFTSAFLAPSKTSIANFREWSAGKPDAQAIVDVLDNKAEHIEALFARSIELGANLEAKELQLVITHGDVHFGNTLETNDGDFYIIDWDSTMLARPGHDFTYFTDAQLAVISKGYGEDLLSNKNELDYYRNHLMIRFVWFWLNKAMSDGAELQSVATTFKTTLDDSPYIRRALGL